MTFTLDAQVAAVPVAVALTTALAGGSPPGPGAAQAAPGR
jgi:hypothetical protein